MHIRVEVRDAEYRASMYNNIPFGMFYKDKELGKWTMRPPFYRAPIGSQSVL
jgi:hypothetical protein